VRPLGAFLEDEEGRPLKICKGERKKDDTWSDKLLDKKEKSILMSLKAMKT
jgi:hypothetical protein